MLTKAEKPEMVMKLKDLYSGCFLTDFENSVEPDVYWVHKNKDGQITAGVQVLSFPIEVLRVECHFVKLYKHL